jgi:hypothetical protein
MNPRSANDPIRPDVLARPITGISLSKQTLGEELGAETRLLVFLRHFG